MTDNARIVRDYIVASCPNPERLLAALTALETELATAKADLERAREAICCEHEWEPCFDVESQQDGMGCRRCDSFRAALAPEQKG